MKRGLRTADCGLRARRQKALAWGLRAITGINAALLVLVAAAFVVPLPDRETGWSVVVEYRDGKPAYVFLSPDDKWRLKTTLDRIDPKFVESLVALEDKRFYDHHGVDPIAIARAMWSDVVHARRVSGGSTLSMQLARLLEPRARTMPSKLADMFRAVQLDLRLSKHEILEEYLSRTPYGDNVEGIEAASWSYFGHGPQHLTPLEIATLLAVPQGPSRYAPSRANVERLRERRDAILGKLIDAGMFDRCSASQRDAARHGKAVPCDRIDAIAAETDAQMTAPPDHLRAMPRQAAHAAVWLHEHHPDELRIRSTLDAGLQALVERQVALRAPELQRRRIFGGAVVVVDHHTRDVVALAGNLDWNDAKHGGQIAMFDRARSPGSTLKPFLYAYAIDRGLALPDYLVPDVPSQYGTYRPKNFDGNWSGLVTLRDALARSLNQPFVDLLQQVGVSAFTTELVRGGVHAARAPAGQLGLSLIVGGIEVTPLELAGLYSALAEDGAFVPLRTSQLDSPGVPAPLFGRGAAWLTRQALSQKDRPDFPRRREVDGMPAQIHWKTGTSFGFRDAWAAGSGPDYTAVVWTGNVDRTPTAELVGSEAAGPLLFDVLEGVADRSREPEPQAPPDDLVEVDVCAYSGHIAGEACDHRVKALAPVHAVPTAPCPYHEAYDVDHDTHRAVTPACKRPDRDYDRANFTVLPSAVVAWLTAHDRAVPDAPVFADGCSPDSDAPPVVTSPGEGEVVSLVPGLPADRQEVQLVASAHTPHVAWFVDGELVATAAASERVYWTPSPGKHEIVVADDSGRKARRTLQVRMR